MRVISVAWSILKTRGHVDSIHPRDEADLRDRIQQLDALFKGKHHCVPGELNVY